MDIQFSARHFNASAGLQDRIQEEMDKLAKFYPNITGASVILDHEVEHQRHCEISVNIPFLIWLNGRIQIERYQGFAPGKTLGARLFLSLR